MEKAKMNNFCGKFLNLFIYLFLFKFDNSFFFYSLYRGLRLIQREEEVCIFYEKVNIEGKKWVF